MMLFPSGRRSSDTASVIYCEAIGYYRTPHQYGVTMMNRIEETRSSRTEDFMRTVDKAVNVILNSGLDVEKIYLFGSYAYGEPNEESDIDLYVVLSDESKPRIRAIDAMEKIGMEIFKSDVYNVEVLAGFEGDFLARASLPTMEKTVFDKGVTLYERTA